MYGGAPNSFRPTSERHSRRRTRRPDARIIAHDHGGLGDHGGFRVLQHRQLSGITQLSKIFAALRYVWCCCGVWCREVGPGGAGGRAGGPGGRGAGGREGMRPRARLSWSGAARSRWATRATKADFVASGAVKARLGSADGWAVVGRRDGAAPGTAVVGSRRGGAVLPKPAWWRCVHPDHASSVERRPGLRCGSLCRRGGGPWHQGRLRGVWRTQGASWLGRLAVRKWTHGCWRAGLAESGDGGTTFGGGRRF